MLGREEIIRAMAHYHPYAHVFQLDCPPSLPVVVVGRKIGGSTRRRVVLHLIVTFINLMAEPMSTKVLAGLTLLIKQGVC